MGFCGRKDDVLSSGNFFFFSKYLRLLPLSAFPSVLDVPSASFCDVSPQRKSSPEEALQFYEKEAAGGAVPHREGLAEG